MKPIALALLLTGFALPAGDPAGFFLWKSAELKGYKTSLAAKMLQIEKCRAYANG